MTSDFYGISAYQQTNQTWKSEGKKTDGAKASDAKQTAQSVKNQSTIETKPFTPLESTSSLIPKKTDYGMTIGNVELSDKASAYYEKLKQKFGNMDFILVSSDKKDQVQKNAAAYGNASKQVVLIDAEKLEKMATDESYRKKYEGIIAQSSQKLTEMKNNLASSGASVMNFGISVDSAGNTSFFATLKSSSDNMDKIMEKRAEAKKEAKAAEKKKAQAKEKEERIEKIREKNRAEKAEKTDAAEEPKEDSYEVIEADSLESLLSKVGTYAFEHTNHNIFAKEEMIYGQNFDSKG